MKKEGPEDFCAWLLQALLEKILIVLVVGAIIIFIALLWTHR